MRRTRRTDPSSSSDERLVSAGATRKPAKQPEPDADDDRRARHRPLRDLRGREHVEDEQRSPRRRRRADGRRRCRRPPPRRPAALTCRRDDRDAGELADPAREHGVPEEPDAERREDVRTRAGAADRLLDHDAPRVRADDHREEVDHDGRDDPLPLDGAERLADGGQSGPRQQSSATTRDGDEDDDQRPTRPRGSADVLTPPPHRPGGHRRVARRSRRAAQRSRPRSTAPARLAARPTPNARRRASSSSSWITASASAAESPGGTRMAGLVVVGDVA